MNQAQDLVRDSDDEYHSYVVRVRTRPSGSRTKAMPSLSIRVEYVNKREAMHFSELSGALEFIAESVRRNVLQAET
jgi:hypothetical protein